MMTPGVRSFVFGFLMGAVACVGFIVYYGDRGGDWLITMGQKMRTVSSSHADNGYRPFATSN